MPKGDTRGSKTEGEGRGGEPERERRGMTEEPPLLNRGNIKKI